MEQLPSNATHFGVRARHPSSQQLHTVSLERNCSVRDAVHRLLRVLDLRQYGEDDLILVVGASSVFEGAVIPPNTKLDTVPHLFKPERDILELHLKPIHVRVILINEGAAVDTKRILVDFASRLCDNVVLFKYCLPKMLASEDYVIQVGTKEGSPIVNSNQTMQTQSFDPAKDALTLKALREVSKANWQSLGTVVRRGMLTLGHGEDVERVEKHQKRYAVLLGFFLVLFKKEGDPTPYHVISLDFHTLKKKKDDKGQNYLVLTLWQQNKDSEKLAPQTVSTAAVASAMSGVSGLVKNTVIGVMKDVHQKVSDFRNPSKNCWIIWGDETGTNESLELWYNEMRDKCLNTGARRMFGIPLEETLQLTSKRLTYIPAIVSKVVSYLDHRLETEGLFRLQGSAALVDAMRDKFELGIDVDLSEWADPHVPATVMKQFFRELPEPLLLYSNYDSLIAIASQKISAEQKRDQIFKLFKETLPPLHMGVLLFLLGFLHRVSRMSDINKMGLVNLGTVFGPNLLRTTADDPMLLLQHTPQINEIMQIIVQYEHDLAGLMVGFDPLETVRALYAVKNPPVASSTTPTLRPLAQSQSSSNTSSSSSATTSKTSSQDSSVHSSSSASKIVRPVPANPPPPSEVRHVQSSVLPSNHHQDPRYGHGGLSSSQPTSSYDSSAQSSSGTPPGGAKRGRPKGGMFGSVAPAPTTTATTEPRRESNPLGYTFTPGVGTDENPPTEGAPTPGSGSDSSPIPAPAPTAAPAKGSNTSSSQPGYAKGSSSASGPSARPLPKVTASAQSPRPQSPVAGGSASASSASSPSPSIESKDPYARRLEEKVQQQQARISELETQVAQLQAKLAMYESR